MEEILVSTVTPVYRGASTVVELAEQLLAVKEQWNRDGFPLELIEAIFVDDGSIDGSSEVLEKLAETYSWIRVVTLSRNFGQHPATVAGILHSCGDWVITLDEDLQHEPRFVLDLLRQAAEQRLDVVYAKPRDKVHHSAFRDLSYVFKRLLALVTDNPHVRIFNSFRAIRGSVAHAAAAVVLQDTYFDVALSWFTDRMGVVPLSLKDKRYIEEGSSGYDFWKLLQHARRLLVSSQTKLLRLGSLVGIASLALSGFLALFILVGKLIDPSSIVVKGWLSTFLTVVFFGGVSSFLLGVLLEYLSTILLRSHGRPPFFVVDRERDSVLRELFARLDQNATGTS